MTLFSYWQHYANLPLCKVSPDWSQQLQWLTHNAHLILLAFWDYWPNSPFSHVSSYQIDPWHLIRPSKFTNMIYVTPIKAMGSHKHAPYSFKQNPNELWYLKRYTLFQPIYWSQHVFCLRLSLVSGNERRYYQHNIHLLSLAETFLNQKYKNVPGWYIFVSPMPVHCFKSLWYDDTL